MGGAPDALLAAGRWPEAAAAYRQALENEPTSVAARLGLARALAGAGDGLTAGAWLADAIRLAPDDPQPVRLLADLLLQQERCAEALPLYLQLLDRFGLRSVPNLVHAGYCHEQADQVEQAVALYREALQHDPALLEAHVNLAGTLWRLEDFAGALHHGQQAVALAPHHAFAQRILGTAWLQSNRVDEAQRHLREAMRLKPDFPHAALDLAMTLLLAGRLAEGWPLWEQRWRDARLKRPAFFRADAEWPGPSAPLQGKAIAVYGEQGWGDVLQCLRHLPQLQALGAQVRCVLAPELLTLVEASFPGVHCLRPGEVVDVHFHAALMELPGRLGTTLDTIPAQVPYLRAPDAARVRWGERLQAWGGQRRIGLAWSGSHAQVNNRNRAMPLSLLLPVARLPGVQCFSLQADDALAWTDVVPAPGELVDLTAEWADFADSAAMLEQLDLVITVDTAIAHLAGALGKPVWIMLPPNADWRWLLEREDSPWYPTARLFRRAHGEPREAQVARVLQALQAWLS
ncbi:MAG TPA: tetratricopeptide repeat protein [Ramlibacter sp.]|nr:tetratricopeptide repeat protein [Ramlibacter sp.]